MSEIVENAIKAGVLAVFALLLLFINIKAGMTFLKFTTLWAMVIALVGAGYFIFLVVMA